jgi:hypothetical protein
LRLDRKDLNERNARACIGAPRDGN